MAPRLLRTGGSSVRRDGDLATQSSVPPKVLEPVGRHFGVPDRVLYLVSEELLRGRVPSLASLNCRRRVEPFGGASQQELYAKTLPICRLESAMNSILAHCKNAVCHKSC